MKVEDIMRTDFVSFSTDAKLEEVVKTFSEKKINSAPVFEGKEFVGIVSDFGMISYFAPKEFRLLWMKNKPTPLEQVKRVTAGQLARKPRMVLSPEQPLLSVLPKIALAGECIPVMSKGKFEGLVRGEDVTGFFLKQLAAGDAIVAATGEEVLPVEKGIDSALDEILAIVQREKSVPCEKIAKSLGLSLKTTEKLCESLARHDLIEVQHSFFQGAVARVKRNEKS